MLAGVPAHWLIALLALGCTAGFGGSMISPMTGLWLALGAVLVWLVLALCYRQDRVAVLAFFLRRKARFNPQISSYSRSSKQVRFE